MQLGTPEVSAARGVSVVLDTQRRQTVFSEKERHTPLEEAYNVLSVFSGLIIDTCEGLLPPEGHV